MPGGTGTRTMTALAGSIEGHGRQGTLRRWHQTRSSRMPCGAIGKVHHVALIVTSIEASLGSVARRPRARPRDGHGHPRRPRPDRVPRGGGVEDRARPADRRHDRRGALPGQQGRGLPPRLPRGPEPGRDAPAARDRRPRADRFGPAPWRRGAGRVPPSALVPRRARRADRGAGRAGLGFARVLRRAAVTALRPASSPSARTSAGSSPAVPGGRRYLPASSSTRKSTFQSRNGCSTRA